MEIIKNIFYSVYNILWGDLIQIPLPGGSTLGLSLLVLILIPSGIYFTFRTKFLPFRLFPEMLKIAVEKKNRSQKGAISGMQALIISTATRVGMGNLVGVVAAISAGGAGAVFWMWITALLGSSTAFAEATLAQIYKEKDPLYGGYRGGPAYYIHHLFCRKKAPGKRSIIAILFALSGLICWCGISQVIGNSVSSAFENAFRIPPLYTTILLVIVAAVIVLRKNATVKVLDIVVPVMAGFYFLLTIFIIIKNAGQLPAVFQRIFSEALGFRQMAAGGFGAVIMNGAKRGLFSNEAGSGSAPCAAAAAEISHPAKEGLLQAFGVFIDTIVICSCSAMIMLLTPMDLTAGLSGMDLLQTSMQYHMGETGVIFIAVILWLFSFSTFIGILFYARSNVAYLFGDNWLSQTLYKLLALVMLFVGGLAAYTFVWDLGDIGIGLMTIFNMIALIPLSRQAVESLKDYERMKKK
ncbi:MAG: alanine:cation symporter family protein [Lachnospiraceae bacterium]|mgnify:CR=1 FL=1|jgi:AGCS family alanine or glycine:cation symporter|nr:alanine:cation symporter family protein [Lachnospiraceae bacterium]GFI18919.1 amino-acid carrier protein AlsT [Lachnospiraceae bacterium]